MYVLYDSMIIDDLQMHISFTPQILYLLKIKKGIETYPQPVCFGHNVKM